MQARTGPGPPATAAPQDQAPGPGLRCDPVRVPGRDSGFPGPCQQNVPFPRLCLPTTPFPVSFCHMSLVCRTDTTAHAKASGRTDWFPSVCRTGRHSRKKLEQVLKVSEGQGCFRGPCAGSRGHGREVKHLFSLEGGLALRISLRCSLCKLSDSSLTPSHSWAAAKSEEHVTTCPCSGQKWA